MHILTMLLLALASEPAPDVSGAIPARSSVITANQWTQKPSSPDLARYFPARAAEMGVSGRVVLRCFVNAEGTLRDCDVAEETPKGWGFGGAGLRLSGKFRMRPRTIDGASVEGAQVSIPISMQAALDTVLTCSSAPAAARVCQVDDDRTESVSIWRGADVMALRQAAGREPAAQEKVAQADGRFLWTVTVNMPLQDCPTFNGQPKCDGATKFLPLKQ
ncbi:MAG TPA: TonB family protein [Caulobacteraceae bacterium]|nr:TonB family protein [Caulobacteraceae bacterium]